MVCMSPVVTSGLIDKIAEDYDAEVTEWMKELENCIEVIQLVAKLKTYITCVCNNRRHVLLIKSMYMMNTLKDLKILACMMKRIVVCLMWNLIFHHLSGNHGMIGMIVMIQVSLKMMLRVKFNSMRKKVSNHVV